MNRQERRTRLRQQAKAAARLKGHAERPGTAAEALQAAQRLFQLGRSSEALPGLQAAVAAWPDNADLRGALAYALAATGRFGLAIEQYRVLLDVRPDTVPVLTNLALLLIKTGAHDEALSLLERASRLDPRHANTEFALGGLLAGQMRKGEAFRHYRRAALLFQQKIGPAPAIQHCDDLVKLGSAQCWTGDLQNGLHHLDLAIALRPDHVLALARRGLMLAKLRRVPEAIASLNRALAAAPDLVELHMELGDLLSTTNEKAAERHFREATHLDPGEELARYYLAAARHESPESPPPAYVQGLFDEYASQFEHHLVDILRYRAPEIVCEAVLTLAGPLAGGWRVIDLGCGTGLCGPLIRPVAAHLTGIDLSAAMLDEARKKSMYDELIVGDVAQVLAGYNAEFDLALCTDVMIYLGSLTPIFSAAARALKAGALFAFTTEAHSGEGYVLDKSRRYLHSRSYVEQEAAAHGFTVVEVEPIVARFEMQTPDVHNAFIARRNAQPSRSAG